MSANMTKLIKLKRTVPGGMQGPVSHENKRLFGAGKLLKQVLAARDFLDSNRTSPGQDADKLKRLAEKLEKAEGDHPSMDKAIIKCGVIHSGRLSMHAINGSDRTEDDNVRFLIDNPALVPSDDSFSAEGILNDPERRLRIRNSEGEELVCVMGPLEAYMFAKELLSELGFDARVGACIDDEHPELFEPSITNSASHLLAILDQDNSDFPLMTVNLEELPVILENGDDVIEPFVHPQCTAISLLSDKALDAISLSLKAERHARMLRLRMANRIHSNIRQDSQEDVVDSRAEQMMGELAVLAVDADEEWHLSPYTSGVFKDLFIGLSILRLDFMQNIQPSENPRELNQKLMIATNQSLEIIGGIMKHIERFAKERGDSKITDFATEIGNRIEHEMESLFQSAPWNQK
jgi:hypothetical protein